MKSNFFDKIYNCPGRDIGEQISQCRTCEILMTNEHIIARASAENMDELSGNRFIERRGPDMAAAATALPAFDPSV